MRLASILVIAHWAGVIGAQTQYTCPSDNGKTITTGGKKYKLMCGSGIRGMPLEEEPCSGLAECAQRCAANAQCKHSTLLKSGKCALKKDGEVFQLADLSTWHFVENVSGGGQGGGQVTTPGGSDNSQTSPGGNAHSYACPADDRKTYTTPNGKNYLLKCDYQSPNATPLKNTPCTSMTDCADQCSREEESVICDWNENNCAMKRQYIEPFYQPGVNTWVDMDKVPGLDPPVQDFPDEKNILCTTECPGANGTVYDSPAGERFHIDCGRRHGVKFIHKDSRATFKECIDACGARVACHSVDWNRHTKMCYYGQHHGEPQVQAAAYASAHSLGCAGACRKACSCEN